MKKYLPVLVTGFAAGVLHVVPLLKGLTCCLIVPVAAYFAVILEQKSKNLTGEFDLQKGAILGLLTGVVAAFFGSFFEIFVTFITKNNDIIASFNEIAQSVNSLPFSEDVKEEVLNMMKSVGDSIQETGFSPLYSISIFVNNLIVNPIFGLIGGLVGAKMLNSKNARS